jgi:polyhydroxyalkanoate synthase
MLASWTRAPTFDSSALVDAFGNVPWPLMQLAFHALKPTLAASKLVSLLSRAGSDEARQLFLALEVWGNDNVSFPGACYREYVERLWRDDALVRGDFTIGGAPARLDAIRCPLFVASCSDDHIVPAACAEAIVGATASRDVQHLRIAGGHVGAVVSRRAQRALWEPLSRWWVERDASDPPATTPPG